jgi:phenylacetate-coenzyme A ligase PaaK-like adenylate-forming protein
MTSTSLAAVKTLCDLQDPYAKPVNYETLFLEAMREIVSWHKDNCAFYKNFLGPFEFSDDLTKIPLVPADFFKTAEVLSVPTDEITLHLTSSGTTGQKSQVFFDDWSIGSAQAMVDKIFRHYNWINTTPTNYLLYSYESTDNSKLGTAYTDNFLCKYAPINKIEYALKWNGQGNGSSAHDFDVYGAIARLSEFESEGLPVRIFGFPAFLHFTLERMRARKHRALKLHPDSLIFLGGGWKKHSGEAVSKNALIQSAHEMLGLDVTRVRDGFGSVEHCVPYIECSEHHFHVPVWSKVFVRDFRTLKVLDYEQPGFLNFVSPYITSMPAHNVLMGDAAILHEAKGCTAQVGTDYFEIIGRAGLSKNKSCAVAASELLGGL